MLGPPYFMVFLYISSKVGRTYFKEIPFKKSMLGHPYFIVFLNISWKVGPTYLKGIPFDKGMLGCPYFIGIQDSKKATAPILMGF